MGMKMSRVPVERVFLDSWTPEATGEYEFTIDCGAVYFGAVYSGEGSLQFVDQYFYTESSSREDMDEAADVADLVFVDDRDYPVKTYLLTKEDDGNEWLRFHAVVPEVIDPEYFRQKYNGA